MSRVSRTHTIIKLEYIHYRLTFLLGISLGVIFHFIPPMI